MKSQNAGFVLGAIVLAAIIAVAVYFLLLSPALAQRADALARQEAAQTFNESLELQLATKKAEAERLPEYKESLEEIQVQFAPREDIAAVRRVIDTIAVDSAVRVTVDSFAPAELAPPNVIALSTAAAAVGRVSYVEGLAFQDLYATQVTLTVSGTYADVMRAIARLQMDEESRYFLIDALAVNMGPDGTPETATTAEITAHFFTIFDAASGINPGINSGNIDPDTGLPLPPVDPGDAFLPPVRTPVG